MTFVLVHTYGTLKIFKGEQVFNDYAVWLREVGHPFLPHGGAPGVSCSVSGYWPGNFTST